MFGLFRGKPAFDDQKKAQFVAMISDMLDMQRIPAGNHGIEDEDGHINRKAIGYVYGFIDAALRVAGQDMGDNAVGIPVTYQVLERLYPSRGEKYLQFLFDTIRNDDQVAIGMAAGGQQYLDKANGKMEGIPMGFGRFLLEGDKR